MEWVNTTNKEKYAIVKTQIKIDLKGFKTSY
jgi:hypothetical protein